MREASPLIQSSKPVSERETRVLVSVLMPLYNEEALVGECLRRVASAPLPQNVDLELIVVDDASTDRSADVVREVQTELAQPVHLIRHERNRGKGAALSTALLHARGEFSLVQDADLEYNPGEFSKLLAPLLSDRADAVFGSRFLAVSERCVPSFWHSLGNRVLTLLCNMVSDLSLTDMETCYKAFRTSLVRSIPLRAERFGIEPELTIKLAQRRARICEVPIDYFPRTYAEGKKIRLKDAVAAVSAMLRFGLFQRDIYRDVGDSALDALAAAPHFNRWMAETVRPFVYGTAMEIGAGIGNLSHVLSGYCDRYIASDNDREHVAGLRRHARLEAVHADLESYDDFRAYRESIDSVVCLNVLEHVQDDIAGLENIFHTLRPGGKAVILVPEGMSIFGTLDEVLKHCRRYSEAGLISKLERVGFQVERILHFNRITRPGWYVNGRLLKRRAVGRLQIRLFDKTVWIWRRIDRLLPWKPTSIIAVAVRPK